MQVERVVDVYERFISGYTLTDRSRVSIRMFIEKLGVHEVLDAMERACTNTRLRRNMEFKYFCGICWSKVKEGS